MRQIAIAILFLLIFPFNSFSTCIVIINYGYILYIAADSKETFEVPNKPPETICKIHNVYGNYFAVAGHAEEYLTAYATQCIERSTSIASAINCYEKLMKSFYQRLMNDSFYTSKQTFKLYLHQPLGGVAFFYAVNGKPRIDYVEFRMKIEKGKGIVSDIILLDQPRVFFGLNAHIKNSNSQEFTTALQQSPNPAHLPANLIRQEMKYDPYHIGEPIDELQMTGDGIVTWLTPKRNCNQ